MLSNTKVKNLNFQVTFKLVELNASIQNPTNGDC